MRVHIDSDRCQGHGQCVFLCPEVFGADEQGFGVVRQEEVPEGAEADAQKAEASCPEGAIRIARSATPSGQVTA